MRSIFCTSHVLGRHVGSTTRNSHSPQVTFTCIAAKHSDVRFHRRPSHYLTIKAALRSFLTFFLILPAARQGQPHQIDKIPDQSTRSRSSPAALLTMAPQLRLLCDDVVYHLHLTQRILSEQRPPRSTTCEAVCCTALEVELARRKQGKMVDPWAADCIEVHAVASQFARHAREDFPLSRKD